MESNICVATSGGGVERYQGLFVFTLKWISHPTGISPAILSNVINKHYQS